MVNMFLFKKQPNSQSKLYAYNVPADSFNSRIIKPPHIIVVSVKWSSGGKNLQIKPNKSWSLFTIVLLYTIQYKKKMSFGFGVY